MIGVSFNIYKEGANTDREEPVASIGADIVGGKAEAVWTYMYKHDPQNPLKEKPKYIFTVSAHKAETVESSSISVKNPRITSIEWEKSFAYVGSTIKLKVKTFEMAEIAPKMDMHFVDANSYNNSTYLFSMSETFDADEKEIEVELLLDSTVIPVKNSEGYGALKMEFKNETYSYLSDTVLDILLDALND